MNARLFGISAIVLALAGLPALAQGAPAQAAATPQLVKPTGVGGCIFDNLPPDVQREAIEAILSRAPIGAVLKGPVAAVAPRCTGQTYSDSDAAVVGSVFSVFTRIVAAYALGGRLHLPQRQLDAAWAAASPAEKAPFVASAETFLAPDRSFAAAAADAAAPFARRLQLAEPPDKTLSDNLAMYYSATALSELAEHSLAARGAHPVT